MAMGECARNTRPEIDRGAERGFNWAGGLPQGINSSIGEVFGQRLPEKTRRC